MIDISFRRGFLLLLLAAAPGGVLAQPAGCGPDYPADFPCIAGGTPLPAPAWMQDTATLLYRTATVSPERLLERIRGEAQSAGWAIGTVEDVFDQAGASREFVAEAGGREVVVNVAASRALAGTVTLTAVELTAPTDVAPDVLAAANAVIAHRVWVRTQAGACRQSAGVDARLYDDALAQWESANGRYVEVAAHLRGVALTAVFETEGLEAYEAAENAALESNREMQSGARARIGSLSDGASAEACAALLEAITLGEEDVPDAVPAAAAKLDSM